MEINPVFIDEQLTFERFSSAMQELNGFCEANYAQKYSSVCVAVSGGADSMSLLILAKKWAEANAINLSCVTVNHQLRKESTEEAEFVQKFCNSIGIKHQILKWNHDEISEAKLENSAREARYKLMADFCEQKNIPVILTGHTWNDELETYAIREKFGSSETGLAGISRVRSLTNTIKLLRPLLSFTKVHLETFLKEKKIIWKIDSMNNQENFLRVACRKKISTCTNEYISTLSKKIISLRKSRTEIELAAVSFLKAFCVFSKYGFATIELTSFLKEPLSVQTEIFKRVVWNIGGKKYAVRISEEFLQNILSKKLNTIGKCLIKIKKGKLFVFRENRDIENLPITKNTPAIWDNRFLVKINSGLNNCVVKSCQSADALDIPKEAFFGLPCVYSNDEKLYIINETRFEVLFFNKVNLFDVFL